MHTKAVWRNRRFNHLMLTQRLGKQTLLFSGLHRHTYKSSFWQCVAYRFTLYSLKRAFPHPDYTLLKSYLTDRIFQARYQEEYTKLNAIQSGVTQGSILAPILYSIWPASWLGGQNFWLLTMRSWVQIQVLPWEISLAGEDPHSDHDLGSV
jgi:hypothetical protein